MLEINTEAPNFTLKNQDNEDVSLSDFKEKWVLLYFYPKDETPLCTKEACSFRDKFSDLEDKDVSVLGISSDSVESHKKFANNHGLKFNLLSDESKSVIKRYKAKGLIFTKRVSYLIKPDGKIAKTFPIVNSFNHAKDVLDVIISRSW